MFRNPFDGARAKLERTRKHFSELVDLQTAFSNEQPLQIDYEHLPNGNTVVFARIAKVPPLSVGTVVADILGGFRSSLDIAVIQACRGRGQHDAKLLDSTYFAVAGSHKDWLGNLDRRMAGADHVVRSVVESFKPWRDDGNVLLYGMTKLTAKDKHIDLVPVGASPHDMRIEGLKLTRGDGQLVGIQSKTPIWGASDRVELMTILAPAQVEIIGPCVLKAQLGFPWDAPALPGYSVVPSLYQMGNICEQVVNALEACAKL